jgi:hypothetical protein
VTSLLLRRHLLHLLHRLPERVEWVVLLLVGWNVDYRLRMIGLMSELAMVVCLVVTKTGNHLL